MTPSNPLSTVGLLLTLGSLLGSFFYLHLSTWLRDILALRQKTELNIARGEEAQKRAIVECQVELRKLNSWHTYVVNTAVVGFVVFIMVLGLQMVATACADPLAAPIHLAMLVFLVLFLVLALGLMALGWSNAQWVKAELKKP